MVLVIVGSGNAVNLTDGLDGLAIGPMIIASGTYLLFAYIAGNAKISSYLQISSVQGAGELAILCGAMVGAGLGFLWFNTYPAQVFMGDVGSLSLGGALGLLAIFTSLGVVRLDRDSRIDLGLGERTSLLPRRLAPTVESRLPRPQDLRLESVLC